MCLAAPPLYHWVHWFVSFNLPEPSVFWGFSTNQRQLSTPWCAFANLRSIQIRKQYQGTTSYSKHLPKAATVSSQRNVTDNIYCILTVRQSYFFQYQEPIHSHKVKLKPKSSAVKFSRHLPPSYTLDSLSSLVSKNQERRTIETHAR